jgi:hypothetical protein
MLLFKKRFHAGLVSGEVTLTFRRWDKPHVRPGGRYRCHPIGVLEVDRIEKVRVRDIREADARRAGLASRAELLAYLREAKEGLFGESSEVFRVELHHGGDGDRVELALEADLSPGDVEAISVKLARMDAAEPWTRATLELIRRYPRVAASKLAARLGRKTLAFKADVRRLKRLGLTQSFEVGYEISPRGVAFMAAAAKSTPKMRRRNRKTRDALKP